jgi:hypothetical protein
MKAIQVQKLATLDGILIGAALIYLVTLLVGGSAPWWPLALPLLCGGAFYYLVSRLGSTPRTLSDIITALTVAGVVYTLFLFLLLLPEASLPGYADPRIRGTLYLFGTARGVFFLILLLFNHLTWSFNVKNYLWILRAPLSFVLILGILMLTSFQTWLLFPPAIIIFLLLIPSPRRVRVVISFVPSLMAAIFIMPILGMTVGRGQLLESIIWVMAGAVLSIVGSIFISIINKTSPYQKAFFFVIFFAFFILFSSVYFYGLLAFSIPPGETSPNILRIVPQSILDYFNGEKETTAISGLPGVARWASLLLALPWFWFLKERYKEYKEETDPQHKTFSAGLLTAGALVLIHAAYAPALLIGWPALFSWGLLGTRLHPPPESLSASTGHPSQG